MSIPRSLPSRTKSSPDAVRAAYDMAAAEAVAPVALGVGIVCLGYAPLHFITVADRGSAIALTASAFVSAAAALSMYVLTRSSRGGRGLFGTAHQRLAALVLLCTWNCALNLALTGTASVTTNFVIVGIGVGVCLVEPRWVYAMLAVVAISWAVVAVQQPHLADWAQPAASLVGAVTLALVLNVSRRRALECLVEARERAEHASVIDSLTGLYNRRGFVEVGERAVRGAEAASPSVSVAVIDVDRFKNINDTLGHEVGDRVLECVGRALTECFRSTDVVSRWGGDEFAVVSLGEVLPASELARRVNATMARAAADGIMPAITVSVGTAVRPAPLGTGADLDALFVSADRDMYERRSRSRPSHGRATQRAAPPAHE